MRQDGGAETPKAILADLAARRAVSKEGAPLPVQHGRARVRSNHVDVVPHPLMKARMSAFTTSAFTVSMPCENPG